MANDEQQIIDDFNETVNMAPRGLNKTPHQIMPKHRRRNLEVGLLCMN